PENTDEPMPPEPEPITPPTSPENTDEPMPPVPEPITPPASPENTDEPMPPVPEPITPPTSPENTDEPMPPEPVPISPPSPPMLAAAVMPVETESVSYHHEEVREVASLPVSGKDTPPAGKIQKTAEVTVVETPHKPDSAAVAPVHEVEPIQQPAPAVSAKNEAEEAVAAEDEAALAADEPVFTEEPSIETITTDYNETETVLPEKPAEAEVLRYQTNPVLIPAGPQEPVGQEPVDNTKQMPLSGSTKQHSSPAMPEKQIPSKPTPAAEKDTASSPLKSGAYYIQVAYYTDNENVNGFRKRFEKTYPISVEKAGDSAAPVYKVYIGPIKKDERGAALETFRKLGFKDAFIKKVP
ncbi:MAG: SPOR domain-containing protein, partial [Treponema sp.]